ncbi:MAG: helix-turn-helix transcriptional regulator [Bifidobacteriaceae bacterium]|jgi:transcriptional regulator with XRE-family HTH domain|nr:helix-turn-helix transcriptional regulator [Bifidobacteriaceae bacterium]
MSNYSELFEKAIAAEMRAQKARKNMTEAEIADRIGVHRVSISRYLSGARPLPLGIFADLCRVLGMDAFEVVNIAEIQAKKDVSGASKE